MTHLLDSDFCISHLRGKAPPLSQLIPHAKTPGDIKICTIVVAELLCGAKKSNQVAQSVQDVRNYIAPFKVLDFDLASAEAYSDIRADLEKSGLPIGPNDLFIAAIALANNSHSSPATSPSSPAFQICDSWTGERRNPQFIADETATVAAEFTDGKTGRLFSQSALSPSPGFAHLHR